MTAHLFVVSEVTPTSDGDLLQPNEVWDSIAAHRNSVIAQYAALSRSVGQYKIYYRTNPRGATCTVFARGLGLTEWILAQQWAIDPVPFRGTRLSSDPAPEVALDPAGLVVIRITPNGSFGGGLGWTIEDGSSLLAKGDQTMWATAESAVDAWMRGHAPDRSYVVLCEHPN